MRTCACLLSVLVLPPALATADEPIEAPPVRNEIALNGQVFSLPAGFTIEQAAGPGLVERPITADFDDEGRLYVADSSGSNEKVEVQLQKKPHRIVRLEDTNGDGLFDKSVVFADKMMFPEGTMWLSGSLYVAAPPSIWKLTDTDGDGVADERIEWFQGKTLTGCANDLHGPYRGPDGWIYWCKGAFARQTYDRPGQPPFTTRASHIFRCQPDGSGLEPVMTGGMDNPVDVVFTAEGERIFTTTFLQHPGGGKRDGLIHAIYGGIYGKDHDPIYEHPWTGPDLMPVLSHLGPAAPCGLACYESRVFGEEYQGNLFACLFNMHKLTRHVLTPSGATFTSKDEDFLVSSSFDFHPTDVIEDADGSLLVCDTGGWYKLCCPTSQLVKPDVLGAIYRIRRQGAAKVIDPRGKKLAIDKLWIADLVVLLDDPRPAVRRRATEKLAAKGKDAIAALEDVLRLSSSAEARRNAVWTLSRIDHAEARKAVRGALKDRDESVRQASLHVISLWRYDEPLEDLIALLHSTSMPNQRTAAEALGRIGDVRAVLPILRVLSAPQYSSVRAVDHRTLEHSLTYALIEIGDSTATAEGLLSREGFNMRTRRAAMIALDQMPGGKLDPGEVVADLTSPDAPLRETAAWIVMRHPDWGPELAGFFRTRLADSRNATDGEREELSRPLARLARSSAVQELLAEPLRDAAAPTESALVAARAMAQSSLKEAPEAWLVALGDALSPLRPELHADALAAARALPWGKQRPEPLITALRKIGEDERKSAEMRLTALTAIPDGISDVSPELLAFVVENLPQEKPVAQRAMAADVVARARLTTEQLLAVCEALQQVGPMEINRVLETFAQSSDENVGRRLVVALRDAPAFPALRADAVLLRLKKFGPAVEPAGEELAAHLNADLAAQRQHLEKLLAHVGSGDIRRGQAVFKSAKLACASCHAVGYVGGSVGPDLTRIGQVRTERDLLESVAFPSASFVQGYEPWTVLTSDGRSFNGVLKTNAADEIVLAINATEQVRIARSDIEQMEPSKVSAMPAGLDKQLTPQELADLVAFLKACR
ncbi:MAG: HEAT repeat domain-containing protein [Planctomycetia bacterium]|nr:HEAT repeat domain-containing protein [Planctomycetia bacterium]